MRERETEFFPITRDQFAAWLVSKGDEVVGYGCCTGDCPLANAGTDILKEQILIFGTHWNYHLRDGGSNLPYWAWKFVMRVDSFDPEDNAITADEARQILESI